MFVLPSNIVALHFVDIAILNKLYPDIFIVGYLKAQLTMLQFDIHSFFNFRFLPSV